MLLEKWRRNRNRLRRVGEIARAQARAAGVPSYYRDPALGSGIVKEMPDGSRVLADEKEEVRHLTGFAVLGHLHGFDDLASGWDGSGAASPVRSAIDQADLFVRAILTSSIHVDLYPMLDVDGSVILEVDDGSMKFKGDGRIVYAFDDGERGIVDFDGRRIPEVVLDSLVASKEPRQDRA